MARRFKKGDLIKIEKGYSHREHRSKKGRAYKPEIAKVRMFKRKKEKLLIKSIEHEALRFI
jgi:competence protein ComGF